MKITINGIERDISPGADLALANLAGAQLTGADLTGANLTGADLRWANLTGADLRWAYGNPASLPKGWKYTNGSIVFVDQDEVTK